jgi:hypothetical protein
MTVQPALKELAQLLVTHLAQPIEVLVDLADKL